MPPTTADRRRWIVLSVLIISLVAIVLDNTVQNFALKTISEPGAGLGASRDLVTQSAAAPAGAVLAEG